MKPLPDATTAELCAIYPNVADAIRWYVTEPRLMPHERTICVVCDTAFASVNNAVAESCSIRCNLILNRQRYAN